MVTDRTSSSGLMPAFLLPWSLALTVTMAGAVQAAEQGPDRALSTFPQHILVVGTQSGVADPTGAFNVHVVNGSGSDLPGVTVTVDLAGAPEVELSSPQPACTFVSCTQASAVTDNGGIASFILVGRVINQTGTWSTTSTATITAGTTTLGTVRVAAFDLDGVDGVTVNDLHLMWGQLFYQSYEAVMDYDGSGANSALDLSVMVQDLISDFSSDPAASCAGTIPPSGKIQLIAAMILTPAPDCQTGAPTSYCTGAHTDFLINIGCPLCTFTNVTGLEAGLTLFSPSGGTLPAFWRFDGLGCHSQGFQLSGTSLSGDGCLDNSPLFLNNGDGYTLGTNVGWVAKYPNPATGLANEEALRLVHMVENAEHIGPGIPGPSGPCSFGYGTLPKIPGGPKVPAFALRVLNNKPSCGACNAAVIKIRLDWVKLTRVQPADRANFTAPPQCPAPQPRPGLAMRPTHEFAASSSSDAADTSIIVIFPDGSGSNEITVSDTTTSVPLDPAKNGRAWLAPAVPNPTPGAVAIAFSLARTEWARLVVVDISGRIVRTLQSGEMESGPHRVTWDGRDQSGDRVRAGVYFCRLGIEEGPLSSMIVLSR